MKKQYTKPQARTIRLESQSMMLEISSYQKPEDKLIIYEDDYGDNVILE